MSASRSVGASSWIVWRKRATTASSWSRRNVYSNKVESRPAPKRVPPSSPSGSECSQLQAPRFKFAIHPFNIMSSTPANVSATANKAALAFHSR